MQLFCLWGMLASFGSPSLRSHKFQAAADCSAHGLTNLVVYWNAVIQWISHKRLRSVSHDTLATENNSCPLLTEDLDSAFNITQIFSHNLLQAGVIPFDEFRFYSFLYSLTHTSHTSKNVSYWAGPDKILYLMTLIYLPYLLLFLKG